ncbi:MAG: NADPH-dependent FMN reductase [Flaviflexus sp.]|nr:NADPH-dependent FMN reductase [Flaviflexus sp.]
MTMKISVLVGSLRGKSFARRIANQTLTMFPEGIDASIVEIRDLPLYDFDYDDPEVPEKPTPEEYRKFRETIKASDGILFVTPENNRCIPACLKNAVDIGSKPNNDVAWTGIPVGIISHSVGRMGGYSSQKNLRLALSYFDMPTLGQPEVFINQSHDRIDDEGNFTDPKTKEFIEKYIARFADLVAEHAG